MSTFKKLLALTLALAMVLSVSAFAGYSADTYADADKIDADCEDAVELMYALSIMTGDGKNFNPEATVTRAEMAKMIYVILNYGEDDKAVTYKGAKMFSDVEAGSWYEGYVNYCAATKLVQGRGDGTFAPMAPVTTPEAAKMLLTAIGYSAEARGYTGANWAINVLSDATIIGLLNGYKAETLGAAPRQWVAVMFENALLKALTYDTIYPQIFSGLLTGNTSYDAEYSTMGGKYYHLDSFEKVAVATTTASLNGDFPAKGVLFSNDKAIKGTGLGALDLGQTYVVIYDTESNEAYSVRSTSDVAVAHVHDMEVDIKYGTSANKANNKYEFTIDEMVAKFGATEIPVLYTGTVETDEIEAEELDVEDLYDAIEDDVRTNDLYKAIDTDCDGDIDYMIVVNYDYAQVTKVGSHNKYGDYIVLENAEGEYVKFNNEKNLYLKDAVNCEDELEKTYFVKYTWDMDAEKYDLEVLYAVEEATYEARDNKKEIYTIDGEDFMVADNAYDWGNEFKAWLKGTGKESKLGKTVNYVADGDMLIARWDDAASYITEIDEVNELLALVIDVDDEFSTGTLHEKHYIEYMTIDGETQIAEYKDKTGYVQFSELEELSMEEYEGEEDLEGRLFVYELDKNGKISLSEIDLEEMGVSEDLLNLYEEKDAELDATGSSVKFDGDKMAADNSFFYAYDDDGEAVFGVITPAEMGDGADAEAYGQVMSYVKSTNGRTTVLAGYVVFDLSSDLTTDYLYIKEIGKETADGLKLTVEFIGGEEAVIYVENDQTFYTDLVYAYTYYTMDDEYTLTLVDDVDGSIKWYDEEDTELRLVDENDVETSLDVSDDDEVANIVVVTIEYVRDETQTDSDDEDYLNEDAYEEYERTLEIVDYKDLDADAIEADETDSYVQTSYWYYDAEMVYIVVLHDMTQAQ